MRKPRLAALVLLPLASALSLQAQSFRGRIFLPSGEPLSKIVPVILTSEDPRLPAQYYYTDSKGWFFLNMRGLSGTGLYSVTVESDGETYATTTESFFAGRTQYLTINLRPLVETETVVKSSTVSVQQLQYKPHPDARRAYEEGMKAYSDKNVDLARQKFRQAVELDNGYVRAYNELAVIEILQKRYAEAEPLLRTALEKDPEAPLPLMNLGIVLNHLGRHQEAIEPLRKTLQLRPRWLTAKVHLGIALLETNLLDEAEPYLIRGTTTKGREEALAYLYLGKLYMMKGHREKAVAAWENYLQRDPASPNATEVRAMLARFGVSAQQP